MSAVLAVTSVGAIRFFAGALATGAGCTTGATTTPLIINLPLTIVYLKGTMYYMKSLLYTLKV